MRTVFLILLSVFLNVFILYLFLTEFVGVVDVVRVEEEFQRIVAQDLKSGNAKEALRKRKVLNVAFKKALSEQRKIIFVSQAVLKGVFEDITDEVLERTRYWYAYYLSSSEFFTPEGGDKQGRQLR